MADISRLSNEYAVNIADYCGFGLWLNEHDQHYVEAPKHFSAPARNLWPARN